MVRRHKVPEVFKNVEKKQRNQDHTKVTLFDRAVNVDSGVFQSRQLQRANKRAFNERLHRTVFVGNLPLDVTKKKLLKLFNSTLKSDPAAMSSKCEVISVRFRGAISSTGGSGRLARKRAAIHREATGVSKNLIAYVVLSSTDGINAALSLNGYWLECRSKPTGTDTTISHTDPSQTTEISSRAGQHIRVDKAITCNKNSFDNTVFIGNLPFNCTEEEVRAAFASFGSISNIRLIRDRTTGAVKGFGYVSFDDPSMISLVIRASETVNIQGRPVRIQEWKPNNLLLKNSQNHANENSVSKIFRLKQQSNQNQSTSKLYSGSESNKHLSEKQLAKKMKRKLRREAEKAKTSNPADATHIPKKIKFPD